MGLALIERVRQQIRSGSGEAFARLAVPQGTAIPENSRPWPADSPSVITHGFPVRAVTLDTLLRVYHRFNDFHAWLSKLIIQRLLKFSGAAYAPEGQSVEVSGVSEIESGGRRPIAFEGLESGLWQVAEYASPIIIDHNQGGVAVPGC